MFGRLRTKVYWGGVADRYPTEPYRIVRYGRITLPNAPVRFGTNSIPIPRNFGNPGMNSILVRRVPVYPLPQYRLCGN